MKKLLTLLSVLALSFVIAGSAQAAKILKFGTYAEFPPFEYIAAKGIIDQYDGIDVAIAKAIAEDNGMKAKIENLEFDSLIMALKGKKIDAIIAGMTITEERKKSVSFSKPYFIAKQVMIVRKDSTIKKASDMAGKRICVIQGYTGETSVKKLGFKYEALKKAAEAILELQNKKCDVVVLDYAPARKYVADTKNLVILEDDAAFGVEEYGIAVNKENADLIKKIDASLEKLIKSGAIEKIVQKYYNAK